MMNYYGQYNGDYISHFGRSKTDGAPGRGSGRYPLGSGNRPYQGQPQLKKIKKVIKRLNKANDRMEIRERADEDHDVLKKVSPFLGVVTTPTYVLKKRLICLCIYRPKRNSISMPVN